MSPYVLVLADSSGGPPPDDGPPPPTSPTFSSIAFPFSLDSVKGVFWNAGTQMMAVMVVVAVGWAMFERFLNRTAAATTGDVLRIASRARGSNVNFRTAAKVRGMGRMERNALFRQLRQRGKFREASALRRKVGVVRDRRPRHR